jgi:HEAT repeat protein
VATTAAEALRASRKLDRASLKAWVREWIAGEPPQRDVQLFIARSPDSVQAVAAIADAPGGESYLFEVVDGSDDRYLVPVVNAVLGDIGSQEAIGHLVRRIHDPSEDVKASAICALSKLGNSSLTPILLDALADRSGVAKDYATMALYEHGDERAVEPVADRTRAILGRERRRSQAGPTALMFCLAFLMRWSEASGLAAETLSWARTRIRFFHPEEWNWFNAESPSPLRSICAPLERGRWWEQ